MKNDILNHKKLNVSRLPSIRIYNYNTHTSVKIRKIKKDMYGRIISYEKRQVTRFYIVDEDKKYKKRSNHVSENKQTTFHSVYYNDITNTIQIFDHNDELIVIYHDTIQFDKHYRVVNVIEKHNDDYALVVNFTYTNNTVFIYFSFDSKTIYSFNVNEFDSVESYFNNYYRFY